MKRREFLTKSALTTAGTMLIPNFLKAYELNQLGLTGIGAAPATGKTLVIVQLSGGNDGLNTVVPYRNDIYYRERPKLAIARETALQLTDETGLHPALSGLKNLFDEGQMAILNSVGYPNPDRSHFRSMDIWQTASPAQDYWTTGWLGRFLDNDYPAFLETPPSVPPALQIGVEANLIFSAENANMALAVSSPQEFYQIALTGQLFPLDTLGNTRREQELFYVRQTANAAFRYAETIRAAYNKGKNQVPYPADNKLAAQMAAGFADHAAGVFVQHCDHGAPVFNGQRV
jgi:uncharacterized protein (DUF1501 family)